MSATATEMVAVLMTDLVGSTALADRIGPEVAEELRTEHFGLLRGALARSSGREVKNLGDGLMVVFDSAAHSLKCAVEMQQAVEARNRRAKETLSVRIGVSAGDTTAEDGDYFGEPVVESARLCASAAGGQIVVTALVRQLAGSRDGHIFDPLGALELKGISEPVQASELRWEPAAAPGAIALPDRLRELPATAYIGRVSECAQMADLWEQAREGSLRVALISGEAGVGKTRLSTHVASQAHGEGATVLFGRCDEDLGVPYQPWVQALAHLVKEGPQAVLDAHVESFGGDLARIVPALADRVPEVAPPRQSDPETERYLMYAAVAGLLAGASEREPLLVILDDLHWADSPTLSLLRHVVASSSSMRVMVIGTYRDSDLSREHALTALLADLRREQGVQRLKLTGLGVEEVVALMEAVAGQEMDEVGLTLAAEITRDTAGNPFFAGELLRHLTESGAIVKGEGGRWRLASDLSDLGLPESVREVVGRRVERLGADARTALSVAAVIGREFDLELLIAVVDLPEERLLDLLEEAVAASLLQEDKSRVGRFAFTHGLVEHTLYEDLAATRRARLHKRVGEALEVQCGEEPGERLGELAGHWAAAVVSADTAKAIHYTRRAAERALQQLAPGEAVRWYRRALELFEQAADGDASERCELLIGLGDAQRQIGDPEHRRVLLEAAALAQELGDAERLCRAVLANSRGWFSQAGVVDTGRVEALDAAARALPHDDPRRARVLALLACELHQTRELERCRQLAFEAIEIARANGDPATVAYALGGAVLAINTPDTLQERERLSDEVVEAARRSEDPLLLWAAAGKQWEIGMETGDHERAESGMTTARSFAASVPEPAIGYARLMAESCWACTQGQLQASERWSIQMLEAGTASAQPDTALIFGSHIFNIRYHQGRLVELVDQLVQSRWRPAASLALIESGRTEEARELALAEDFPRVRWDWIWSMTVFYWSDACSRLGLADRAAELYTLMLPFSGQIAMTGAYVAGSYDWALGTLARTQQRHEESEGHFAAALEIEQRLGAPLFVARSRAGWAQTIVAREDPGGLARAHELLAQAEEVARPLGGGLVIREVAECRAALAAVSG